MSSGGGIKLGNPAPLGLLAFGITTGMLMFVDTGWVEDDFEQWVASYALFYGGICQLLVAIFELMKGSSFSFAVFGSYGAFWLGWGTMIFQIHDETSGFDIPTKDYSNGKAAWLLTYGILSLCFFIIVLRKNTCLIITFGMLVITFFLLSASVFAASTTLKHIAGYFGFLTAAAAFYTGVAELINEEYGRMVLPGLSPIIIASRLIITKDSMATRIRYDVRSNTLFLAFREIQVRSIDDIETIRSSVEQAIQHANAPDNKVHVIVDYDGASIAEAVFQQYWNMVEILQAKYYLTVSRFRVSSFGSGLRGGQTWAGAGFRDALSGGYIPSAVVTTGIPQSGVECNQKMDV
jgi:uncharacterized protein